MNNLPRIAIIGYGAMGREVERLASEQGFPISEIFDVDKLLDVNSTYEFDVAIDFTQPAAVTGNVKALAKLKKNIVIGTTGWNKYIKEVSDLVTSSNIGAVTGSNFSVGMQMFTRIVDLAARLLDNVNGYDIMLHEMHHRRKLDSPSGTALTLADIILKHVSAKTDIETETQHGAIDPSKLHVSSSRGGEVPGTHTLYIDSAADTIEITHRARSRTGFASGALVAAAWIHGKQGFYDFSDVMDSIWS